MKELLFPMAVALVMGAIIDYRDRVLHRKERMVTVCLALFLGVYCGLRTWYNDTTTYITMYEQATDLAGFWNSPDAEISGGIGFGLLNSVMKTIGLSTQDYLMSYALATMGLYVVFLRRYCSSMTFGIFLLFATGMYPFACAAVKQCMATAVCLYALPYAESKKWIKYTVFILIAVMFHPYAVVFFIVPLMMFKPWTIRTLIFCIVFIAIGFSLEGLLGTVLSITDMIGANYTEESFLGEGVNVFRVAVAFVPMVFGTLYGKRLFRESNQEEQLMFNLSMVNALIMFVGMFGTANYFARLANYFLPAQVIILPWILKTVHPVDRRWLIPACVAGYMGYFAYEYAILRPFDDYFSSISLWQYLSSFF